MRKGLALLALGLTVFLAGCRFPDFGNLVEPNPDDREIEAGAVTLDAQKGKELRVWYSEHDNVWDARVHSLDTCPFLAWTPNATRWRTGLMPAADWGEFLHDFFRHKHKEEKHCDCDELLGIVAPPAPPAPAPDVTGTFTIEPDVAPPRADPPDDEDDDRDKLIEDLLRKYRDKIPDIEDIKPK